MKNKLFLSIEKLICIAGLHVLISLKLY